MLFSSIGIGIARYQKKMLKEKEVFGAKIWFQVFVRGQLYSKCSHRDISLDRKLGITVPLNVNPNQMQPLQKQVDQIIHL